MIGYYNMPEKTAEAIDADGWLHTGDLGLREPNGYYRITGRLRDMIIRGGENIYPREIEERLYQHPAVAEVQVVGVPDPRWGEEVLAWVKFKCDQSGDGGRAARVLPPVAGPFQDAAVLEVCGLLSDDRHREDSEVQDSRAGNRGFGLAGRGED